jgi:hypothetical protein
MARFDVGVVFACLGSQLPRLGALFVTLHVFAAFLVTVTGLLKEVVHFLQTVAMMLPFMAMVVAMTIMVVVMIVVTMMVVIMVMIAVMPTMVARKEIPHRWALLMACMITWPAGLVAGMNL